MARPKANEITKVGRTQVGYKESPANSNKTKYGKLFGMNGVPWCAIYNWFKGLMAAMKVEKDNPIYKSASAANIQDLTVKCKGGSWIMPKTKSKAKRLAAVRRMMPDDIVSFDFGEFSCVRYHTGTVDNVEGDYVWCNEGNTSGSGSQSNGGAVLLKKRKYTDICSVVRPKTRKPKPRKLEVLLAVDGDFGYQTRYRFQWWLGVEQDDDLGPITTKALQKKLGMKQDGIWTHEVTKKLQKKIGSKPDGDFGKITTKDLQTYLNKIVKAYLQKQNEQKAALEITGGVSEAGSREVPETVSETVTKEPAKKKTIREKIVDQAIACAWPKGTPKKKYKYPGGKRRKAYIAALKKAFGKRKGWRKQTKMGASCDVFAAAVIRTVYDKKFPRGCDDIIKYMNSKRGKKYWKAVDKRVPGCVTYQKFKSGAQHMTIDIGGGYVANAHYCKKTYPIVEKASKVIKKKSKCKKSKIYVPRLEG